MIPSFIALAVLLILAGVVIFYVERSRWESRYQGHHRGQSRLQPVLDLVSRLGG